MAESVRVFCGTKNKIPGSNATAATSPLVLSFWTSLKHNALCWSDVRPFSANTRHRVLAPRAQPCLFSSQKGREIFLSRRKRPDQLVTRILPPGLWEPANYRDVVLTANRRLVPRLRMRGVIPPFPLFMTGRGQGRLCLLYVFRVTRVKSRSTVRNVRSVTNGNERCADN